MGERAARCASAAKVQAPPPQPSPSRGRGATGLWPVSLEPATAAAYSFPMTAPFAWIRPEPHGIHVVPADCWIDPARAVSNALVTHGHADHARGGHGRTVATAETLAIMEVRCGPQSGQPLAYDAVSYTHLTLPTILRV